VFLISAGQRADSLIAGVPQVWCNGVMLIIWPGLLREPSAAL
jgi:hypothetical protein